MNEPTMGEVLRRLDDVARQLDATAKRMHEDRLRAEQTFVRLDVYNSDRRGDERALSEVQRDVQDVQEDRKTDVNWRRQVMLALACVAITAIVTAALAVSNYLAR
jgi:hypothetical protein